MVREVSPSEARVISHLLAEAGPSPPERANAGLPRSTYVVARRRAFREGWVYDRYVPHPQLLGVERLRLQLARPYAEGAHELAVRWKNDPGAVLLWRHPALIFGVFFDRSSRTDPRSEASLASALHVAEGGPTSPLLPVYFDHEATWNALAGLAGTSGYPRALGGSLPPLPARDRIRRQAAFPSILEELLARTPSQTEAHGRPLHLRGTFGLPRSRLRLLEAGLVQRRVFVDFARLPPVAGRRVDRLMLLHGRLLPGARPQELFRQLVEEAQVHPFLLAVGTAEVIVGAFATATTSSPSGPEREGRARPLETMLRSLRGIDPFWADLRGLDVLVDHAYDRLGHRPD